MGKEGGSECEKNPGWDGMGRDGCGMSRKYHKSFLEDEMVKEKDDIGNFVRWGIGGRGRWVGGWIIGYPLTYLPTYFLCMIRGRELCALPSSFCSGAGRVGMDL